MTVLVPLTCIPKGTTLTALKSEAWLFEVPTTDSYVDIGDDTKTTTFKTR